MTYINPLKKKRIIDKIVAEFKKIDAEIPTLNRGGCGVFAYEAYKLLDSLGIKVKLGVITINKSSTSYYLKNNGGANETPFDHIILCIGRKFVDSGGLYTNPKQIKNYERGYDLVKGMPLELLSSWLTESGWNRVFDKQKYKPIIKQRIKDIKKDLAVLI